MGGIRAALDTNVVIAFLNGDENTLRKLESCEQILLPFPVKGELLFGAMCSQKPKENLQQLSRLFDHFDTINSSLDVEQRYARIKSELKHKGRPTPFLFF